MDRVIREKVCEAHPERKAYPDLEGFAFFWPPTGQTFRVDPCDENAQAIITALADFVGSAVPLKVSANYLQPNTEGLPEGMMWLLGSNAANRGNGSRGMAHATYIEDRSKSKCGLVSGEEKWLNEPVQPSDPKCSKCTAAVRKEMAGGR